MLFPRVNNHYKSYVSSSLYGETYSMLLRNYGL
ncbi:hypothetical protein T01_9518 [Trichinella spiralis]|uniref:Uncharacterized protein n=1 Tax=Trichinella spiralis TaxID=6334 RepID=A0A0V1AH12_TRISP|nr:hypothetical protein T01_9518 [Trichinella spiralis]